MKHSKRATSTWAVPVIHPAATFRAANQLGPLVAHVEGFLRRGLYGFEDPPKLEANPSLQRLNWLAKKALKLGRPLSIDVEAAPPDVGRKEWALLPMYARLRVVGVGIDYKYTDRDGNKWDGVGLSWFYPVPAHIWRRIRQLMADPKYQKLAMNGTSYDMPMLERHGVRFAGELHDIRDMRRAQVSTSRTALAFQASIYRQTRPWKAEASEAEDTEKGYVDPSRISRKKILRYNAEDTVRAAQVWKEQLRDLDRMPAVEQKRILRLYEHGRRLAMVGAEMSIKGFPVNEARRKSLSRELTSMARDRAREFAKLIEPYADVVFLKPGETGAKHKGKFKISSNGGVNDNDLAALLYEESKRPGIESFNLDVPITPKCRTESGKPAVNRDALLYLFAQDNTPDEVKRIVFAAWKADAPLKVRGTYVDTDTVLSRIGPDGRLHASINTCAAETGRWTCSDPNIFNLSEAVEEESGDLRGDLPNVREMYEAPESYVIVHRDWSGIELEVVYDITGDLLLGQGLKLGDVHTQRARVWFKKGPNEPVPPGLRKTTKTVGFSSGYGAGLEAVFMKVLAKDPSAKWDDVARLHALYRENHTGIVAGWDRALRFAQTSGYNETRITGRRRYYPADTPIKITECLNYEVQGTAADIANCTMVGLEKSDYKRSLHGQLKRYFPSAWLAMHTYDSFDVICKKKDSAAVNRLMEDCMSAPRDAGKGLRSFPSDGKIDRSWGKV